MPPHRPALLLIVCTAPITGTWSALRLLPWFPLSPLNSRSVPPLSWTPFSVLFCLFTFTSVINMQFGSIVMSEYSRNVCVGFDACITGTGWEEKRNQGTDNVKLTFANSRLFQHSQSTRSWTIDDCYFVRLHCWCPCWLLPNQHPRCGSHWAHLTHVDCLDCM